MVKNKKYIKKEVGCLIPILSYNLPTSVDPTMNIHNENWLILAKMVCYQNNGQD